MSSCEGRTGTDAAGLQVFEFGLFFGVIAGADEGAGFDDGEFQFFEAVAFVGGELVGVDPAVDGEVLLGGLEVLADGEDIDIVGAKVAEGLEEFFVGFADADHEAGFGDEVLGLGTLEEFEGAFVFGLGADFSVLRRDGFGVVVEDVGFGVEDGLEGVPFAAEIGDEDFDGGVGIFGADVADGFGPDLGAAVGEFVAVDGGDDAMLEFHEGDGFGDAAGLVEVERGRAAGGDVAEAAGAGADVAEDHDGGGAAGPAFAHVGAFGGFADGVELVVVDGLAEGGVGGAGGEFDAEPRGFSAGESVVGAGGLEGGGDDVEGDGAGHLNPSVTERVKRNSIDKSVGKSHGNEEMGNFSWSVKVLLLSLEG